jgi:spore germination cell wall hydrolase CwlJ-like protein
MKKYIKLVAGKKSGEDENARAFYNDMAADVLACTIWGEARGQGQAGMEAVTSVILNRVAVAKARGGKYWWGNDVISVCQKPYQFSCWNRTDPNYKKLIAVTEMNVHFVTSLRIARRAIAGTIIDRTGGATHYHTTAISPYWSKGQTPTTIIGDHVFFRLIEA